MHRLWSEAQNKWIKLKLSSKGLRIIDKYGLDKALEKYDIT
jgi:large subunit ribosomal protein L28